MHQTARVCYIDVGEVIREFLFSHSMARQFHAAEVPGLSFAQPTVTVSSIRHPRCDPCLTQNQFHPSDTPGLILAQLILSDNFLLQMPQV